MKGKFSEQNVNSYLNSDLGFCCYFILPNLLFLSCDLNYKI